MSTKIWQAWRVPKSRLNEFLASVREASHKHFYEMLDLWIESIGLNAARQMRKETEAMLREECKGKLPSWYSRSGDETYLHERWKILSREMRKASRSSEHRLFDADASLNIWLDKRHAYIIPYGKVKLPVPFPAWVEDYHYQNQTDRPENISVRQWEARRRKWDAVCLDDWNATRLSHLIVDFSKDAACHYEFLAEVHLGIIKLGKANGQA